MILTSIEMETFLIYFLQVSLGIVLFYFLYLFLLKNETFYHTNRYFLLAGLLLAALLPAFPITYESPLALMNNADFFSPTENSALTDTGTDLNRQDQAGLGLNYTKWLTGIYVAGVIYFLLRLVWQTSHMMRKIRHSNFQIIDGVKIIDRKTTMPFSFFNVVFIDIQEYTERELSNIIAHEKVHIRERHWVDLLIIELMAVLFWINPVVWLYERSIKQNHEYLADQGVLVAGYSPGQYQAILINQLMGVKILGFAHNLNFSLNKKRMEMMKKEKSPGASKMKLLLALPIIALLVFSFAKKEYVVVDGQRSPISNKRAFDKQEMISVKGQVIDNNGNTLVDTKVVVEGSNIETKSKNGGKFEIEAFRYGILVFSHHGYKTTHYSLAGENMDHLTIAMQEEKNRKFKLHGWVRDENRQLLEGANVTEKNTTNGTVTDDKGMYFLEVSDGSSIVISYVGYKTVEVKLSHRYNQNGVPTLSPTNLQRGVFDIKLPDMNDPNFKMKLPPPPPPEDFEKLDKELLYKVVEQLPYYENGGMGRLALDIKKEVEWVLNKTKDRGETVVGFTVAVNSKIVNPHIVKSSGSKMLDASAVKIIAKLDNWWAGMQRGKRVPVDLAVPVRFE